MLTTTIMMMVMVMSTMMMMEMTEMVMMNTSAVVELRVELSRAVVELSRAESNPAQVSPAMAASIGCKES